MINDLDVGVICDGLDERCTAQAVYAVTQHRIGHCNLGVNVVRMLCPTHTAMVLQANAFTEPFACTRCGRVFHTLHDLIETEHLVTGAGL
jgi:hypothetical protein